MSDSPTTKRSDALAETRKQKLDEMFSGKKFEILKEIHLPEGELFQTPLGNKGRHGFAIREQGNPSNQFIVGKTVLKQASEQYGAVDLPEKKARKASAVEEE